MDTTALLSIIAFVVSLWQLLAWRGLPRPPHRPYGRARLQVEHAPTAVAGFPTRKAEWVRRAVLTLDERTGQSHRKLADTFNRMYFARTGISVGRTWVRELLKDNAYRAMQARQRCKHRVPPGLPNNVEWGMDTTTVRDSDSRSHIVFGLVDHGSRLNLMLRTLPRFNTWTLLGTVFLAIGSHGKPAAIRLDNHPVHHAKRFKTAMRWLGIRLRFSQPASPWQNGRIERFFGTFKLHLRGLRFLDVLNLQHGLEEFSYFYNHVRGHQHLGGRTPAEIWHAIDSYQRPARRCIWFEGWGGRLRGWQLQH